MRRFTLYTREHCRVQILLSRRITLEESDHGLAHGLTDVHVREGITAVVRARAAGGMQERVRVYGRHIACKLGVLGSVGHVFHGIQDETAAVRGAPHRLAE